MAIQRDKVIANAEKLVAKGKIEPAIKEYERLLDDNPNDVNTLNRIGDLWVRINRNDEAVKTFGRIADRIGRVRAMTVSILVYSFATAGLATSQALWQLVAWRTLVGVGMGGEWSCGTVLVAEKDHTKRELINPAIESLRVAQANVIGAVLS